MTDSSDMAELLYDYAAGQLSGKDAGRVEAALEGNPHLQKELARYERLIVLLTVVSREEVSAPRSLKKKVERQVAMKAYLGAVTNAVEGILGAYGRAIVYYLGLM